jgi:cytidylate kinase
VASVKRLTIAIDGPAGAGKSTAAKRLARRLGYTLLDTGAIYRAVALRSREENIDWGDGKRCAEIAHGLEISFAFDGERNRVHLGERDVSDAIRQPAINEGASKVSALPEVRAALLDLQRRLARGGGVVAEGRDVGTVVFPNAEVKVFLTASAEARARRRFDEDRAKGLPVVFEKVLAEQIERDERDSQRQTAPLKQADDAVLIDSSSLTIDAVVDQIFALVETRAG